MDSNPSDPVTTSVAVANEREFNEITWDSFCDFISNEIQKCYNHGDWLSTLERVQRRAEHQRKGAEARWEEAAGEAFAIEQA